MSKFHRNHRRGGQYQSSAKNRPGGRPNQDGDIDEDSGAMRACVPVFLGQLYLEIEAWRKRHSHRSANCVTRTRDGAASAGAAAPIDSTAAAAHLVNFSFNLILIPPFSLAQRSLYPLFSPPIDPGSVSNDCGRYLVRRETELWRWGGDQLDSGSFQGAPSAEGKGGLESARKTAPSPPLTAEPARSCNLDSPGPFTAIRIAL